MADFPWYDPLQEMSKAIHLKLALENARQEREDRAAMAQYRKAQAAHLAAQEARQAEADDLAQQWKTFNAQKDVIEGGGMVTGIPRGLGAHLGAPLIPGTQSRAIFRPKSLQEADKEAALVRRQKEMADYNDKLARARDADKDPTMDIVADERMANALPGVKVGQTLNIRQSRLSSLMNMVNTVNKPEKAEKPPRPIVRTMEEDGIKYDVFLDPESLEEITRRPTGEVKAGKSQELSSSDIKDISENYLEEAKAIRENTKLGREEKKQMLKDLAIKGKSLYKDKVEIGTEKGPDDFSGEWYYIQPNPNYGKSTAPRPTASARRSPGRTITQSQYNALVQSHGKEAVDAMLAKKGGSIIP